MDWTLGRTGVTHMRYCAIRRGRSTHVAICIPLRGLWKPLVRIVMYLLFKDLFDLFIYEPSSNVVGWMSDGCTLGFSQSVELAWING